MKIRGRKLLPGTPRGVAQLQRRLVPVEALQIACPDKEPHFGLAGDHLFLWKQLVLFTTWSLEMLQ
jgi:hypothetical protein